jgi:hypothetical protein
MTTTAPETTPARALGTVSALLACPFCGAIPAQQCVDVWHVTHRRGCWCAPKVQRIVGAYAASCWQTRHANTMLSVDGERKGPPR